MRSAYSDIRVGRCIVSVVVASLVFGACRGDAVTGYDTGCSDQPGCDTRSETLSPGALSALEDASTRLTGALSTSLASALSSRLDQLEAALKTRNLYAGRLALAATYDVLGHAERSTPEARPDLAAVRLALIPAARVLGVFSADAFPSVSQAAP